MSMLLVRSLVRLRASPALVLLRMLFPAQPRSARRRLRDGSWEQLLQGGDRIEKREDEAEDDAEEEQDDADVDERDDSFAPVTEITEALASLGF